MTHKRHVPYVEQMQQTECGLCCATMILNYYKSQDSLSRIREKLEAGRDGMKLSVIASYLKKRGMETKIYKADYSALDKIPLPAIIFWDNEHFVVLEKIKDKVAHIVDPAFGRRKVDRDTMEKSYSGVVMVARPTENFKPVKDKVDTWSIVTERLKKNKLLLLKVFIMSIIVYSLQMSVPIMIQKIIDSEGINNYGVIVMALACILGVVNYLRGRKLIVLQIDSDFHLSKSVFSKILRLPYKYFEGRAPGDILFRMGSVRNIRDLLSEQFIQTVMQAGALIFIFGYMLMKSVTISIVAMLIFVASGVFIMAMKTLITEVNQDEMMKNTILQTVQVETIYSMFTIKTAGMENETWNNWKNAYDKCLSAFKRKSAVLNLYTSVLMFVQNIAPLFLLGLGIFSAMKGNMTLGESMAIYSLAGSFFSTGIALYNFWNDFVVAGAYMERLHDIIDADDERNPEKPITVKVSGDLDINHVSFAYTQHSDNVLSDIDLHIKKGEKVAIVGASGSGKSTLAKIILGLYEPQEGDVRYDGVSIRDINKNDLRKQIGVVPQDMVLFNQSIYENIRMSQENLGIDEVKEAAEVAQIRGEIEQMPMKYYTMVSDMGMNLSGGQRQRIALARAIVHQNNLIVLDEATSALDYENERKISDYLGEKDCTRIVIAHRLSTIIDADKIVVLDHGRIREIGNHKELMEQGGLYSALYQANKKSA
ncbi:ABC-type bacteriocin/lantibiotic exporter, contains an N-terminal double-glycine peptidase domain [Butyrivibrio sp. ob235]|uniref:peptidase domain-containing ABC transporter n=1 Tax=Butyrivibrio sp. ob235 TaxID=1761780 RepID=UPI0008B231D4|nr:peptidase domain-containing ABC transporter [Butyrivibrio sp. ob235]SEM54005.1 ABC-type bacteriocin/lantibiotic exporter, contains an N-terminal double-glycine peptidase domain [Butyrivibrio sp. ob235]